MIRQFCCSRSLVGHSGQVRYYSGGAFSCTAPRYFWKKSDFENMDRWARRKCIELNRDSLLRLTLKSPLLNTDTCRGAVCDAVLLGRSESLKLIIQEIPGSLIDESVVRDALMQTVIYLQPECLDVLLSHSTISEEALREAFVVLFLCHKDGMGQNVKDIAQSAWKTCKAFCKASVPIIRVSVQGEDPNHSSNREPLIHFDVARQEMEGKLILLQEKMDRYIRVQSLLEKVPYATPSLVAQARIEAMLRRGA
jgi:hypothetical protein